jgi:hypothetical protein
LGGVNHGLPISQYQALKAFSLTPTCWGLKVSGVSGQVSGFKESASILSILLLKLRYKRFQVSGVRPTSGDVTAKSIEKETYVMG